MAKLTSRVNVGVGWTQIVTGKQNVVISVENDSVLLAVADVIGDLSAGDPGHLLSMNGVREFNAVGFTHAVFARKANPKDSGNISVILTAY